MPAIRGWPSRRIQVAFTWGWPMALSGFSAPAWTPTFGLFSVIRKTAIQSPINNWGDEGTMLPSKDSRMKFHCLLCLVGVLILSGCAAENVTPLPQTHAVRGVLVDDQGKPVTQGDVQFKSLEQQGTLAFGKIQSDGTFVLETPVTGKKIPGAVLG